ncbi:tripartite tricarboxylate transporter TctB family protein [Rhodobium gokarnense]|uniref:DUF1468 domain-containing protein n=1 Tax=Rhodobium gokarnense TaxID=364296 RepID=A0ABT3H7E0_9HYPH|nr:tripartite tricarboxylate transporter TctB family protein [Rhodobium gokarnense]MCW2306306.1 hypothetical protein [Rhodobium gokarnense]
MSDIDDTESEGQSMARKGRDKLAGIILLVISGAALINSLAMERIGEGIDRVLGAPGLTPGFLSAVLVLLSIALIVRSWSAPLPRLPRRLGETQKRMITAFAIIFLYIGSLYWVPYFVSTFVMLAVFQIVFASRPRTLRHVLGWGLVYSAAVAGALYYVFGEVFYIPLP